MGNSPDGRFTDVEPGADTLETPTGSARIPEQASGEERSTQRWKYATAVEVARSLNSRR